MNGRSARPSMVLVTETAAGTFLVQGYPTGAAVYLSANDGAALRQVLDDAFDNDGQFMDMPPIVRPRLPESSPWA